MKRLSLLLLSLCFSLASQAAPFAPKAALYFIENKGQITDQHGKPRTDIDFVLHSDGLDVFIGCGRLEYQWKQELASAPKAVSRGLVGEAHEPGQLRLQRIDVALQGAATYIEPIREDKQSYYERYYLRQFGEKGITANAYQRVTYKDVYPGIEWVVYIKDDKLEYDFVVQEGADPGLVRIKYSGAEKLELSANGSLQAAAAMGAVREAKPYSYGQGGRTVASAFTLEDGVLGFALAPYTGRLVIDPVVDWSTYFLGTQDYTAPTNITVYNREHIYMCGYTTSPGLATTGAHQTTLAAGTDGFLVKFDSAGNRLWATYYGGQGTDDCVGLVCDMTGDIYISGSTSSSTGIATAGTHQPQIAAGMDAYLAKFDNTGARIWGTYYGGAGADVVREICIAGDNEPYVCGNTSSDTGIATPGTHQLLRSGGNDIFLARFSQSGTLLWGTYYGGLGIDVSFSCAHDQMNSIYVLGGTYSLTGIATTGSHQPNLYTSQYASYDACLARFNDAGQLVWGTYYGGEGEEQARAVVCDGAANVYFTGTTGDENGSFPTSLMNISTPGSYQPAASNNNREEGFLVKFDSAGSRIWGTYFGGTGNDELSDGLDIDQWSNLYFTGQTTSASGIVTNDGWQQGMGSVRDAFVTKFDSAGGLLWSSYFGGEEQDFGQACAFDGYQSLYICGLTQSSTGIATTGAFQVVNPPGAFSAYLARINDCVPPSAPASLNGGVVVCQGDTLTYSVPTVNGAVSYTWALPNGWTGSSTTNIITVITGAAGGSISVTAQGNCGISTPLVVSVSVLHPQPVITVSGNQLSAGSFSTYQWYLNGSIIPGATAQTYNMTQPGTYTVVVTDNNGCTGTSAQVLDVVYTAMAGDLYIYPNPANDIVTIGGSSLAQIVITNLQGQVVIQQGLKTGKTDIDVSRLQPGVYFLTVTDTDGRRMTEKVVKR